jgi:hypothetical protein
MLGILIGIFIIVLSLLPKAKFYNSGAPGAKHGPPIEPRWIPRLILILFGLAAILDGLREIRHH